MDENKDKCPCDRCTDQFFCASTQQHCARYIEWEMDGDRRREDPVRRGFWIHEKKNAKSIKFICSVCGRTCYDMTSTGRKHSKDRVRCTYDYCPRCGAKMTER